MNVKATTVCFSEPPLSNRRLLNETWTMTDLYFKIPRWWKTGPRIVQMLKIWLFAVSDGDEGNSFNVPFKGTVCFSEPPFSVAAFI